MYQKIVKVYYFIMNNVISTIEDNDKYVTVLQQFALTL